MCVRVCACVCVPEEMPSVRRKCILSLKLKKASLKNIGVLSGCEYLFLSKINKVIYQVNICQMLGDGELPQPMSFYSLGVCVFPPVDGG